MSDQREKLDRAARERRIEYVAAEQRAYEARSAQQAALAKLDEAEQALWLYKLSKRETV